MKQYLNITNLKILTILIGLIATITLLENSLQIFKIFPTSTYSDSRGVSIHYDVAKLFFCWCPYFFFKALENILENYFEKIGFTRKEDDKNNSHEDLFKKEANMSKEKQEKIESEEKLPFEDY